MWSHSIGNGVELLSTAVQKVGEEDVGASSFISGSHVIVDGVLGGSSTFIFTRYAVLISHIDVNSCFSSWESSKSDIYIYIYIYFSAVDILYVFHVISLKKLAHQ